MGKHGDGTSIQRTSSESEFKCQCQEFNNEFVKMANAAGLELSVITLKIEIHNVPFYNTYKDSEVEYSIRRAWDTEIWRRGF
ncbi:unnamed protein product [Angiostrongylus costaricensis]|uniref:Uncharacterized protein n=1 Tax=Angiostrongylus costaricensis TaxID=334426 RepID=A0A0R3PLZ7_ANGCS|nr:unnamed protein product [Angiostrongylus costaricensis]